MRRIWTKIPSMISIAITLVAIYCLVIMAIYFLFPGLLDDGTSFYDPGFEAWQCSLTIIALSAISMVFYAIDAIFSAIKASMRIDTKFNIALALVTVFGVLFGAWILTSPLRTYKTAIWFSYYFLVLPSFEIISIVRCVKQRPKRLA